MRPQRIHHSDDDGDCDSNSANDADVDDDSDDGGKQQRKQVQQQHSSPATKTTRFATTPMRARAPPFVPKSQHQPAARTVLTFFYTLETAAVPPYHQPPSQQGDGVGAPKSMLLSTCIKLQRARELHAGRTIRMQTAAK